MATTSDEDESAPRAVLLPAECDLGWARTQHEEWLEQAAFERDAEISAGGVERMTTPAVQLLLAYARALDIENHRLVLREPSPAFVAAFADLGLETMVTKWSAN